MSMSKILNQERKEAVEISYRLSLCVKSAIIFSSVCQIFCDKLRSLSVSSLFEVFKYLASIELVALTLKTLN